jgi:putative polyketide hydroxylase
LSSTSDDPGAPVLIAGGGPIGLSLAIALGRFGVRSVVLERHPGTAIHPKARGVDVRTMEVLRQWGLEGDVRDAGLSPDEHGFFFRAATLTSPDFERFGGGGQAGAARQFSPTTWMVIAQDVLEPILLRHARAAGADVRFGHELVDVEDGQDGGLRARVLVRETGGTIGLRAGHIVGADGAASRTREALGVRLVGHGPLVRNASILFRADLAGAVADRRSAVYFLAAAGEDPRPRGYPMSVGNPPPNGVLLAINNRDRWLLVVGVDGEAEGDQPTIDPARCLELIRAAVGLPALEAEVLSVLPWTPAARVAERYAVGAVFLAGDAAHEMTPSGAFGLNVGIQDAHNLGWKLAAAIRGWAGHGLLATYDAERRPIARFAAEQSYLQFSGRQSPRPFGNWGVILGAQYESSAILPDGTPPPDVADPAVDYVPLARPGSRAPHAWLTGRDERSTLDLLGDRFTLLSASPRWLTAGREAASRGDVPLAALDVGGSAAAADPAEFERQYGIGAAGAVLVRPDGYVAWRTGDDRGASVDGLARTLRQILSRD